MAQTPCIRRAEGDSIDYTPVGDVARGDVVVLGTRLVLIANKAIAGGVPGALETEGLFEVPKVTGSITKGAALYWDADGDPLGGDAGTGAFTSDSSKGPLGGWAAATSASGMILLLMDSVDSGGTTLRSGLGQDDAEPYPVLIRDLKVWDSPGADAVVTTAAND